MNIKVMSVGIYGANCYFLIKDETNKCVIIDPGGNEEDIIHALKENNLKPEMILLTHGHMDHTEAMEKLKNEYEIPICMNEKDEKMMIEGKNIFGSFKKYKKADKQLKQDDIINFEGLQIKCIETPGHTPGGLCFLIDKYMFTGDTLFRESIGRTDFQGGNYEKLMDSIKNKIMNLSDDIIVLPGHGTHTTIGWEKVHNPFL